MLGWAHFLLVIKFSIAGVDELGSGRLLYIHVRLLHPLLICTRGMSELRRDGERMRRRSEVAEESPTARPVATAHPAWPPPVDAPAGGDGALRLAFSYRWRNGAFLGKSSASFLSS